MGVTNENKGEVCVLGNTDQLSQVSHSDIKIRDIGSVRLTNALASIEIYTLDDLLRFIKDNGVEFLLRVRNFGKNSLCEVYQILESFRISEENIDSIDSGGCVDSPINIEILPADDENVIYIPNVPLVNLGGNCDGVKELASQNINTTVDLFKYCNNHNFTDLYRISAFCKDITRKIMNLLAIMHDRNRWVELQNMIVGTWDKRLMLSPVTRPIKGIFANVEEEHLDETIELIQLHYLTSVGHLSVRAQNVIKSEIPYFGDAIVISLLYSDRYKYFRNCGRQTWEEIKLFAIKFCNEIRTITSIPFDDLRLLIALNKISYTQGRENLFISKFYRDNGYLPMFYILASYLVNSENRAEKLYRAAYGILCPPLHMRDIAKQYGLSYERVRQIIASAKFECKNLILLTNWQIYHIEDYLYLSSRSPLYHDVQVCEDLEELSVEGFGYLCKLLYPFTHIIVKDNHYFFAQRLLDCFDIKSALIDIENTLSKKATKDTEIPITVFIDSYWKSNPNFDVDEVINMLCEIITENFDVQIDDNCRITIYQNTVDVSSELYDIINANGDSMSLEDIFLEFKAKYPEHKYSEASQLRPYLTRDNRICPIGKSSYYALVEWDIYTGTIKDLVYDTLLNSDVPLTAEELYTTIRNTFETTPKSIRSTAVGDKGGKFVFFKKGYIGVNGKVYPCEYEDIKIKSIRHRQTFDDKIKEYEQYLITHHHMPFSNGTEDEQSLYRWFNNVVNKCMTITPEREAEFLAMVQRNEEYMINGTEYAFYRRCDDYKMYLEDNMELPTIETESSLYRWFYNNYKLYMSFEDRRKGYFEDLISYIESYGFVVR